MWTSRHEPVPGGLHFAVSFDARRVSFAEVLHALQTDAAFREWFNDLLAEVPFSAFRFETPCVTSATVRRAFEFVVLDDPGLARTPDPDAFAEHFLTALESEAIQFANLRGDAIMVVPTPIAALTAYGHLAAFVRESPEAQRHALWALVGEAMSRRLGAKPVWLSTAGAGVSWLHVRLDDRPKYYGHTPYQRKPE